MENIYQSGLNPHFINITVDGRNMFQTPKKMGYTPKKPSFSSWIHFLRLALLETEVASDLSGFDSWEKQ